MGDKAGTIQADGAVAQAGVELHAAALAAGDQLAGVQPRHRKVHNRHVPDLERPQHHLRRDQGAVSCTAPPLFNPSGNDAAARVTCYGSKHAVLSTHMSLWQHEVHSKG